MAWEKSESSASAGEATLNPLRNAQAALPGCLSAGTEDMLRRYQEFFEQRTSVKESLYSRIVSAALSVCGIGSIVGVTGLILWYTSPQNSPVFWTGAAMACIGTFAFVGAASLISTVPVAELDIDRQQELRPGLWFVVQVVLGALSVFGGAVFATFSPFATSLPLVAAGFLVLLHGTRCSASLGSACRRGFGLKVAAVPLALFLPISSLYLMCGVDPASISDNLVFPGLWRSWTDALARDSALTGPLFVGVAATFAAGGVIGTYKWSCALCQKGTAARPGAATEALNTILYCWMITTGLGCCAVNIAGTYNPIITEQASIAPSLVVVAFALTPPVTVLIIGPSRSFTMLARWFEFKLDRLLDDSSLLADLAASSDVLNVRNNCHWVFRDSRDEELVPLETDLGLIKRSFWAKASIISEKAEARGRPCICVRVRLEEDLDTSWVARYKGNEVEIASLPARAVAVGATRKLTLDDWIAKNFASRIVANIDRELQAVDLLIPFASRTGGGPEALRTWATTHLRRLASSKFEDELLLVSPRELSPDQRLSVFELSDTVPEVTDRQAVDFFVSHSWEDPAESKCKALRSFLSTRQTGSGSGPSIWLDKTCLDVHHPSDALSCLPITIAMCKKVLVVLGPTYLRRLWCIWELFSLFTFCNKELAVERIEVITTEEDSDALATLIKQLNAAQTETAHCFDPNEEFKLREIIGFIGHDRVKATLRGLSAALEDSTAKAKH